MVISVGSYSHTADTAWINPLVTRRVASERGRTFLYNHRWHINFFLYGSTQAELTTAVNSLKDAYGSITGDVVLYDNNGAATSHKIVYADTVNGIRATLVWPKGFIGHPTGTNWVKHVYGIAQVEADTLSNEDNILLYHQTFRFSPGGVGYKVVEAFTGVPQVQFVRQQSKFWGIQQGVGVGAMSNPVPHGPIVNALVDPEKSWITYGTPQIQGSLKNLRFPTRWLYYYESPFPIVAVPPYNP